MTAIVQVVVLAYHLAKKETVRVVVRLYHPVMKEKVWVLASVAAALLLLARPDLLKSHSVGSRLLGLE